MTGTNKQTLDVFMGSGKKIADITLRDDGFTQLTLQYTEE
jgi:hypothetical protein